MPTVGLALGGGGARGLVHLGVIKVLEEENIPIDIICGTSMGAIIGAIYAQRANIADTIDVVESYLNTGKCDDLDISGINENEASEPKPLHRLAKTLAKRIYTMSMASRRSFLKSDVLNEALDFLLKDGNIEDTHIPFGAVATDLNTGKSVLIQKGNIKKAVRQSALVPGFLPPEEDGPSLMADGGITQLVPVESTREMGADIVIAVSANPSTLPPLNDKTMISIIERCQIIVGLELSRLQAEKADILIKPDLAYIHWTKFSNHKYLIETGMDAAKEKLPQVKELIRRKRSWVSRALSFIKYSRSSR